MLKSIYIKNFALIQELELQFSRSLNILMGETGAGKSIIIDALMMSLGERASYDYIRNGEKKAVIESIFDISNNNALISFLKENEIDYDNDLILRRELSDKGSSRAFINDSPVPLSTLKQTGDLLVDFHGQYDHQLLLRPEYHINILDSISDFKDYKTKFSEELKNLKSLISKLNTLVKNGNELKNKLDSLKFELNEIERINPQADEMQSLESFISIAENSENLYSLCLNFDNTLDSENFSARNSLLQAKKNLEEISIIDPIFNNYLAEFSSALISIDEIINFNKSYLSDISFDPEKLENSRLRLFSLKGLEKKYGSYENIFTKAKELEEQIAAIQNFDEEIAETLDKIDKEKKICGEFASKISMARKKTAQIAEADIICVLKDLGMENSQFEIRFSNRQADSKASNLCVNINNTFYEVNDNGIDNVEFFISTNKGENIKPLAAVASGGEISRIMLAIKSIIAEYDNMPVLVFDEIDTGISGKVGRKTGIVMKKLSEHHQIIAITHLAQIASLGTFNILVKKSSDSNSTKIEAKILTNDEKIIEIAKLLSGEAITDNSLQSARELIAYN